MTKREQTEPAEGRHDRSPRHRRRWITATVFLLVLSALSLPAAFISIFLFDDPKRADDPLRDAIGYAMMSLPFVCFCGAALPWMYWRWARAWWLFMLPLGNVAVISLWGLSFVQVFR